MPRHNTPTLDCEQDLWQSGFNAIAGVDEAGRGPLAGPVVAAACILPKGITFDGVDDSKKLTHNARQKLYNQLTAHPKVQWATGVVSNDEIDRINILQAALLAMHYAIEALPKKPDFILVDGRDAPPVKLATKPIIGGDAISHTIACASILAKVCRDAMMLKYHITYPQYGFDRHKGYATKAHLEALRIHGPCPIHRKSFAPIKFNN